MRIPCKVWPFRCSAFPQESTQWVPLLNIRLIYQHSPPTKWFECFVDSGSPTCMFHADVAAAAGIRRIEDGIQDAVGGIIHGPTTAIYYHKVKVIVATEQIQVVAGFSRQLSVAGILGRRGFFDNFSVMFDTSQTPPMLEIERLYRA